jgi:hypothetical protein
MVNVQVDVSRIANEITQIHNDLHATYNMTDNERRDAVNRLVERVRTLKTQLDNKEITATLK